MIRGVRLFELYFIDDFDTLTRSISDAIPNYMMILGAQSFDFHTVLAPISVFTSNLLYFIVCSKHLYHSRMESCQTR